MSTIGSATMVWAEARFLSLIAEQVALVPGPRILLWSHGPWQWLSNEPVPFHDQTTNPVYHWLQANPGAFDVLELPGGPAIADDLALEQTTRNIAMDVLAKRGVDVCLWLDSDYLLTLADMRRVVDTVTGQPPRAWSYPAYHYWRNFNLCHAVSPARAATTTAVRYPEAYSEPDALIDGVRLHHPSYVMPTDEVLRKWMAWGHARLARQHGWAEAWLREDDSAWNPQPAPEKVPQEILDRIERAQGGSR